MAATDAQRDAHLLVLPLLYRELKGSVDPSNMEEIEKGCIQADRVYECYEAKLHGCKVSSIVGQDLSNGYECKLRTTWKNLKTGQVQVIVQPDGTKTKTGDILLGIINRETQTFDRLKIPVWTGYTPGKTLAVTWSTKGKGYGKYQQYLLSSMPLYLG